MKILTQIGRILTGLLFVFSGFVKGIDPMGTAFKLEDYFAAFNLGFLDNLALPLAIILCLVEFVTGMMLLSGSLVRIASWMAALFMALFTPLTLILAFFNPVSDCGCFGDAIVLTNWQTFFKNIAITLIVVFIFIRRDDRTGTMSSKPGIISTLAYSTLFLFFMCYNLAYLPVIDFRPYKTGTNIREAMSVPPDAEPDRYDIRFIYEKEGVQKEFTLNDYPADDTAWKFVDQKSVLISKGYVPPIHGFTLVDGQGADLTEQITGSEGDVMLMIARNLNESDRAGLAKGYGLGTDLQGTGRKFYIVTATPSGEEAGMTKGFNTLFADEVTLKTIIRSDPGFVLLHNGTIIAEWSYRGLPDKEDFSGNLMALALKSNRQKNTNLIIISTILAIALLVAITLPFRLKARDN
jgi:uncharacterized membrane protein YphA (DoxX/SURF4 family)